MKLLFIAESFPSHEKVDLTGGVETGDFYLCKELAKKHQVTVLTIGRDTQESTQKIHEITVLGLGLSADVESRQSVFVRLSFVLSALLKVRQLDFDIIYSSNVFSSSVAGLLSMRSGKPAVVKIPDVYIGDWISLTGLKTGLIGEILERFVLSRKWSAVIAWSQYTARKIQRLSKITSIYVIGGGVDTDLYEKLRVQKYPLPTIVCVARLVRYKRVDVVLKAFAQIVTQIPQINLHIIGIGPEKKHLENLTAELGISKKVKFLGFIPNHESVVKEIKQSHVLMHASEVEGFGLVTLEALACGVPYVHTDLAVTRELTEDGYGGFFFKVGDYQMAADKTIRLLHDTNLYQRKISEAKKVVTKYSWSKVAKDTEAVFNKVLKENQNSLFD